MAAIISLRPAGDFVGSCEGVTVFCGLDGMAAIEVWTVDAITDFPAVRGRSAGDPATRKAHLHRDLGAKPFLSLLRHAILMNSLQKTNLLEKFDGC
jgi:hypothetical protein